MPQYDYINDDTGEIISVIQRMTEEHKYIDKDGKEWRRIFYSPQASIDTKLDPFDSKSFVEKTKSGGTIGDLLDRSKELSDKRSDKIGAPDPLREKYIKDWKGKRGGKRKHPSEVVRDIQITT